MILIGKHDTYEVFAAAFANQNVCLLGNGLAVFQLFVDCCGDFIAFRAPPFDNQLIGGR
jgi:hypothetical protein